MSVPIPQLLARRYKRLWSKRKSDIQTGISKFLGALVQGLQAGTIPLETDRKIKVYVLGRYNRDKAFIPGDWYASYGRYIELSFLSIHRSKGCEADYVILPSMVSVARRLSFPSTMADDPILSLAMSSNDPYPHGEERRLFYVALTRARRSVAMFTVKGQASLFLKELVTDGVVRVVDLDAPQPRKNPCPKCATGEIVKKSGQWGSFFACSGFPACDYKPPKKTGIRSNVHSPSRYGKRL